MKERRQRSITDIVSGDTIRSQSEIVTRLQRSGFHVTQASVSRDLEEMGIRKRDGVYKLRTGGGFPSSFGKVNVDRSGNSLIVAKCASGLASAFAVHLDSLAIPEIVGTIAGDDTVFIAVKNAASQVAVYRRLKEWLGD
jgi:transcriptional regulator of arginine metabolism